MTSSTTSTTTRAASKGKGPRTISPTVAEADNTPVLALDDDIAAVVKACGKFDAIEAGHAEQLAQLNARTDAALAEYVRLARAWKAQRRPIGGFHRAIGSGNVNTHRRLMLTGALWDAYQTVPDVSVTLYRCLQWVNVSSASDIARDIAAVRDSVSDAVGLSHDLPIRKVKATRAARPDDGTGATSGEGEGSGTGSGAAAVIPSRVSTSDPVALVTTARAMLESGKVADLDAFAGAVQALVNAVRDAMAERDAMADMAEDVAAAS